MLRFPTKYSLALASTTVTLEGAFLIFQDSMLMINFKTLLEPRCSTHGAFALLLFLYKLATAFAIVLCWASCTLRKGFLLLCGHDVRFVMIRFSSGWPVGPAPHHLLRLKNRLTLILAGWKSQGKTDVVWNLPCMFCIYTEWRSVYYEVTKTERSDEPTHFQQRW